MKRNIFKALTLSCLPFTLLLTVSITSCNKNDKNEAKRFDGTNWEGLTKGRFTPDDFYIDQNTKTITYFDAERICSKNLVIPNYVEINGEKYKVMLDEQCFQNNTSIRGTVEFNDFIDKIPYSCFNGDESITGLIFHQFPKEISANAFNNCKQLKEIYVLQESEYNPNWTLMLESIGTSAFASSHLVGDLRFYEPLRNIGEGAFANCFLIENVYMDFCDQLTTITQNAFDGCSRIQYIYMPPSLTTIESFAFASCDFLAQAVLPKSDMSLTLGSNVFANCKSFTGLSLPFKINKMGEKCFSGTSLSTFYWNDPYQVEVIQKSAFSGCQFTWLKFDKTNGPKDVYDFAFSSCADTKEINFVDYGTEFPSWTGTKIFEDLPDKGVILIASNADPDEWKTFINDANWGIHISEDEWIIKNGE